MVRQVDLVFSLKSDLHLFASLGLSSSSLTLVNLDLGLKILEFFFFFFLGVLDSGQSLDLTSKNNLKIMGKLEST